MDEKAKSGGNVIRLDESEKDHGCESCMYQEMGFDEMPCAACSQWAKRVDLWVDKDTRTKVGAKPGDHVMVRMERHDRPGWSEYRALLYNFNPTTDEEAVVLMLENYCEDGSGLCDLREIATDEIASVCKPDAEAVA
jgi:hypothetical protein